MMVRILLLLLLAVLPSRIKIPLYRRLFGWKIGKDVHIGLSFIDAREVTMGDGVRIGHFNRFHRIPKLTICNTVFVGNRNVFMTAPAKYVADVREANPLLYIGEDSYIIGPHSFDLHAPIRLGSSVTIAGRGSSFYTHGLDYRRACLAAGPITIGENSYVGAHALFVPGASIAPNTIVGMGALVTKAFDQQYVLVAGSPAKVVKELEPQADWFTRDRPGHRKGEGSTSYQTPSSIRMG
jgi:acetyltransferase-like isoleucine patch superfamily enzyme